LRLLQPAIDHHIRLVMTPTALTTHPVLCKNINRVHITPENVLK
jgi:hypothetical protein